MDGMKPERLEKFLTEPHLLDLATISPDGFPHVAPVWFDYDGAAFLISTTPDRKKARNLKKNSKAGFSIAPPDLPYKAVVGYGTVTFKDDPKGELLKKLARKYLPPEKADKYWEHLMKSGPRVILVLKPQWMSSWEG